MEHEETEIYRAGIWGNEEDQIWSNTTLDTATYEQYLWLLNDFLTIIYDDKRVEKEKLLEDVRNIIDGLIHEEEIEDYQE